MPDGCIELAGFPTVKLHGTQQREKRPMLGNVSGGLADHVNLRESWEPRRTARLPRG